MKVGNLIYGIIKIQTYTYNKLMLSFSNEQAVFEFKENKHLATAVELKNHSNTSVCFKFKINRPKFYLVKPDRGVIKSGESKTIAITLHKDGVSESYNDRLKCFYVFTDLEFKEDDFQGIETNMNVNRQRLIVKINKLPVAMESARQNMAESKNSELKSLGNTGSNFRSGRMEQSTSTYEGIIREREKRVSNLKSEIEDIQRSMTSKKRKFTNSGKNSSGTSLLALALLGLLGFGIGMISSSWI